MIEAVQISFYELILLDHDYLLNISDGLPNISNAKYNFSKAVNHTKSVAIDAFTKACTPLGVIDFHGSPIYLSYGTYDKL